MEHASDYDYDLPQELIAQAPLPNRSDARLLVVNRAEDTLEHCHVRDLPELLDSGDLVVLNDTRVVPARLVGVRIMTRGRWEGLFLSLAADGRMRLLSRTRGKLADGESVTLMDREGQAAAELRLVERESNGVFLFESPTSETVWELLERVGRTPLPPYIRGGKMIESDRTRYQTVYAREPGAVAAPTAGLHFTNELLRKLEARGVLTARVTLHVGMGTFRPMDNQPLDAHVMHGEWAMVPESTAEAVRSAKAKGKRVVAIGTTCVRALESAADESGPRAWSGETQLFIRPGFQFRAVDALLTNFHLPRSTLLVLVRTFGGDALMRGAYEEAISEEYRFYSYGDAMLIV